MSKPRRYTRVDHKARTIEHVLDYRGTQDHPKRPQSLDCDYCRRPSDRLWCRRVRHFVVEMWPERRSEFEGGHWCACVFCEPMVAARDVPLLFARVVIINAAVKAIPVADAESGFGRLYQAVFDAMEPGGAVLWSSGDVWPVAGNATAESAIPTCFPDPNGDVGV